jgi:predicted transcriptional regulator
MNLGLIKSEDQNYFVNSAKLIDKAEDLKVLSNDSAVALLRYISKQPSPEETIRKRMKLTKDGFSRAIKVLDKAGMISASTVQVKKGKSVKVYSAVSNSFVFEVNPESKKLDIKERGIKDHSTAKFYEKFIVDGKFNGLICVGSPDPHGEYRSIARDTHYALHLGMFLGQFVDLPKKLPVVLDTDVISKNLFKENLIVVGGPVTNLITREINNYLPIKFQKEEGWTLKDRNGVHSRDYEGVIEKIKSPFDKSKDIIVFGGVRHIGTLSTILAATQFHDTTFKSYNDEPSWYSIVRGYDIDGDGEIDSVETVR